MSEAGLKSSPPLVATEESIFFLKINANKMTSTVVGTGGDVAFITARFYRQLTFMLWVNDTLGTWLRAIAN